MFSTKSKAVGGEKVGVPKETAKLVVAAAGKSHSSKGRKSVLDGGSAAPLHQDENLGVAANVVEDAAAASASALSKKSQNVEDVICQLRLEIADLNARQAREIETLKKESRESAHRAFCCFTQKNNQLVKANVILKREQKKAEDLQKKAELEVQNLKTLLRLHKQKILNNSSDDEDMSEKENNPHKRNTIVITPHQRTRKEAIALKKTEKESDTIVFPREDSAGSIAEGSTSSSQQDSPASLQKFEADQDNFEVTANEADKKDPPAAIRIGAGAHLQDMDLESVIMTDSRDGSNKKAEREGEMEEEEFDGQELGDDNDEEDNDAEEGEEEAEEKEDLFNKNTPQISPDSSLKSVSHRTGNMNIYSDMDESPTPSSASSFRPKRRSSMGTCYVEPSLHKKLRSGMEGTFNSGYNTGIKTKTVKEKYKESSKARLKRLKKQGNGSSDDGSDLASESGGAATPAKP